MEADEVDILCATLQAGVKELPEPKDLVIAYQRFFTSEYGKVIISDLVRRYPVVAARFIEGQSIESAMQREGAAQVTAYIITQMISRPKKGREKKPAKTGLTETETQNDIQ